MPDRLLTTWLLAPPRPPPRKRQREFEDEDENEEEDDGAKVPYPQTRLPSQELGANSQAETPALRPRLGSWVQCARGISCVLECSGSGNTASSSQLLSLITI